MNIQNKELIETFSYTTINENRFGEMYVKINGRDYTKYGTYQAVTLVGNLYKYYDPSDNQYKKVLLVGASRQHPRDLMVSKEIAYEQAHLNALLNPIIVMQVSTAKFRRLTFVDIARTYINSLDLKFIKTAEEIKAEKNINSN